MSVPKPNRQLNTLALFIQLDACRSDKAASIWHLADTTDIHGIGDVIAAIAPGFRRRHRFQIDVITQRKTLCCPDGRLIRKHVLRAAGDVAG